MFLLKMMIYGGILNLYFFFVNTLNEVGILYKPFSHLLFLFLFLTIIITIILCNTVQTHITMKKGTVRMGVPSTYTYNM